MSRVFGRPRIQRARGIGAGPRGPAQPGLILVLLGGAEAAGLQQRGEAAARAQRRAGLPLQEAGFRSREALAARKGFGVVRADPARGPRPQSRPDARSHLGGAPSPGLLAQGQAAQALPLAGHLVLWALGARLPLAGSRARPGGLGLVLRQLLHAAVHLTRRRGQEGRLASECPPLGPPSRLCIQSPQFPTTLRPQAFLEPGPEESVPTLPHRFHGSSRATLHPASPLLTSLARCPSLFLGPEPHSPFHKDPNPGVSWILHECCSTTPMQPATSPRVPLPKIENSG